METLRIRFTRADYCTKPGGIILRKKTHIHGGRETTEYIVHSFIRERGSKVPIEFFWGAYIMEDAEKAAQRFNEKVERANQYTTGGSLIPDHMVDSEIAKELEKTA